MIAAYILIHTEVGVVGPVAAEVAEIKGVAGERARTDYLLSRDLLGHGTPLPRRAK
jgi:hypothetical protein